ncbi:MAG: hypothetical protein KJ630_19310 [Proteobacteria bacterium]|nr:hypothetical protein [Pseudomonadota bacterium]
MEVNGMDVQMMSREDVQSAEKQNSTEAAGSMPWDVSALSGWSVVGMNHYHVGGKRHLFCAMVKGDRCIKAEGKNESEVFLALAKKA